MIDNHYINYPNNEEWSMKREDHIQLTSLIDYYDIKTVFEIGAFQGYTAFLLAKCTDIDSITAVDSFPHYPLYEHPKITFLQQDLNKFIPTGEQYDLVIIDDGHSYEDVKRDYNIAKRLATKIIFFHDAHLEGVKKFLNELPNLIHLNGEGKTKLAYKVIK